MRALIARDLADAGIVGLSADRRFATAYNAALQAANMAIACAGYRIMSKVGHHRVSLESTKLVLGKPAQKYADYFETCRRKRNTIDYTFSNVATETEAKEILILCAAAALCSRRMQDHGLARSCGPVVPSRQTMLLRIDSGIGGCGAAVVLAPA